MVVTRKPVTEPEKTEARSKLFNDLKASVAVEETKAAKPKKGNGQAAAETDDKRKERCISRLQELFEQGHKTEVRTLLKQYGDGAKNFHGGPGREIRRDRPGHRGAETMIGYEKHELSAEMAKPAPEGLIDPMAIYLEMLALQQAAPREAGEDLYAAQVIDEVLRARRIAEREEARPVEPALPVATSRLLKTGAAGRASADEIRNLKN